MAAAMNRCRLWSCVGLVGGGLLALQVGAAALPPPAYQWATRGTPVPSPVLYALALQESGAHVRGRLVPWPWTLNVAGLSYRFADRRSACSALLRALQTVSAKQVDAGLGQINLGWNGEHFAHPCEALDPYRNLTVATALLLKHKSPNNNWTTAAGRYHRPAGGVPAKRYRQAFARHLTRLTLPNLQGMKTP